MDYREASRALIEKELLEEEWGPPGGYDTNPKLSSIKRIIEAMFNTEGMTSGKGPRKGLEFILSTESDEKIYATVDYVGDKYEYTLRLSEDLDYLNKDISLNDKIGYASLEQEFVGKLFAAYSNIVFKSIIYNKDY